ncbi:MULTISPECIES: MFS transporter [unclassified Rhizobium]|uniref:MFS transporter n=1 Tax=unclassified Rhizobium TaxID=2613769 RepID=UPI001AD9851A|nr:MULTISPECIES: MFS transporter [unclassified Rhizobium]MBO9100994.1 MFS transporter [Rhizobium sp. L58/93]MBO9136877.1 MFS transporter [Rhizobium sp. B209b/85]MBO9171670.1 MFS transporter [Rhizobium sp. L245/93]MBO9186584.1 MFS transporter [Rhizobium sp. E27B/91]QXZ86039.1 MFS transporter [Rhizobium sp. K1/93]
MDDRKDIIAKAARRILPILMLCYFAAFLDRVNIGFAALTMSKDLGFSATAFGFGAGIFFLGYVLCELPSNLILARVGARLWIARILISWGILSAATAFVWDPSSFYIVRILLGAAEAGFFPGMIFFLTLWFPKAYRARMFATFNIAVPLASMIGAPVSSLVIEGLNGAGGLFGWQWMFLIEAFPAVIMGLAVLFYLPDSPKTASFLTADERSWLASKIDSERQAQETVEHFSVKKALFDPRVLLMCLIAVGLVMGTTGVAVWMPQFVKQFGLSNLQTGFVTAIPALFTVLAMILVGLHADKTGDRVWHAAGPFLASAIGFALAAFSSNPILGLIGLTIGAAGIGGASPNIWIFPSTLLTGTAAAAGIALVNSVGSTGGFFGPSIIGWVRDATGSFTGSLLFLAVSMAVTAVAILVLGHSMRDLLKPKPDPRHIRATA